MFHRGQKQHEGDSLSLGSHLPTIPLLLATSQAAPIWSRCAPSPAAAARPQTPSSLQTGMGAKPGSYAHTLEHTHPARTLLRQWLWGLLLRPGSLPAETLPLDLRRPLCIIMHTSENVSANKKKKEPTFINTGRVLSITTVDNRACCKVSQACFTGCIAGRYSSFKALKAVCSIRWHSNMYYSIHSQSLWCCELPLEWRPSALQTKARYEPHEPVLMWVGNNNMWNTGKHLHCLHSLSHTHTQITQTIHDTLSEL